jgi:sugar transferase (PEP-CTERM/EpsH1 system associated)
MNILYLTHRLPYPPNKGDKIRSFHQIQYLAREHQVHLACLVDEMDDWPQVQKLEEFCASIEAVFRTKKAAKYRTARALLTGEPLSVAAFYSRKLEKKIRTKMRKQKIDCILAFSSVMARYVRHVANIPKIMDFVDVDSDKWRLYAKYHRFPASWVYRVEAGRLARYEEEIARTFDCSIFVTEHEARLFQERVTDRPVTVIPNGVDLEYFSPPANKSSQSSAPPTLAFVGAMDYFPNVDAVQYFCDEIFPLVRETIPDAMFYIIGRAPTPQVQALGGRPNVVVTGTVPDIRPYLTQATVAVAPFRIARGIQNKVLEAMAVGLPVVGTPIVFQGMTVSSSDGVRIAPDTQSFAREVLGLLLNPAQRQECSCRAREYVLKHHQWQEHGLQLNRLLYSIAPESVPRYVQEESART